MTSPAPASYTEIVSFRYGKAKKLLILNDPYNGLVIRDTGEYSEAEVEIFRMYVKPDSLVVDAGALIGAHTIPLAELCPNGLVIAFEPQRIPFQVLCGNIQINGLNNVRAYNAALGAEPGTTRMELNDPSEVSYWGLSKTGADIGEQVNVEPLDNLQLPKLDFIKIDTEGDELKVLTGAEKTITNFMPVIYLEYKEHNQDILNFLGGFRYARWIDKKPGTQMLLCLPATASINNWDNRFDFVNYP